MGFFNGHNHTHYSNIRLTDCIIKPEDLINRAIELGLSGIAITDHECISGHMEINQYTKKIREKHPDFTVALGNEIYLVDQRHLSGQPYYHFILIAKDAIGHRAIRELSSIAWYNSYVDVITRVPLEKNELSETMKKYKGHIMATSACLGGELPKLLLRQQEENGGVFDLYYEEKIDEFISFCIDTFGRENFFLECAPSTNKDQIYVNQRLVQIAHKYQLRVTVATDSHYLSKETRFAHKAFLTSDQKNKRQREVDAFYEFARMMDENEVRELLSYSFSDKRIIDDIFETTEYERSQIEFYSLERPQQIPMVDVNPPPPFAWWGVNNPYADDFREGCYSTIGKLFTSDNPQERQWINDVWDALQDKIGFWGDHEDYVARLEIEADVISYIGNRLGTCLFAYFNTFKHYIDLFWDCGSIVGPGRGSATGFLSNYLLGITQLDPIKWNLPWFRFLNKERVELPDIDIDLSPSKRPAIFSAIRKERGELGLVQVATFGTEGSRAAIQTACRGYRHTGADGIEEYPDGINSDEAIYFSSLVPTERGFSWTIKDVVFGNEEKDRRPITAFVAAVNKYPGLLDIILQLEGVVSHCGIHASGVMLYDANKIYDTAAIMRAPSGDLITAYDLHMAEAAGDTKYDFLVTEACDKIIQCIDFLKRDKVIEDANLKTLYNKYLHPETIDTSNPKIWSALAEGSVLDVFQFNSGVGLAIAKKLRPQNPIEMTAANAMMRLMSEKGKESQQDRYARIQQQGIEVFEREMRRYGLPSNMRQAFHKYADEYWGCFPTQEQMMLILMDENVAHFTLGEANAARKIVAKKKMDQIPTLRQRVYEKVGNDKYADYLWETAVAPQLG